MGWIWGFTRIVWFLVVIQGIDGAAPAVNVSDYEDVKTIGDYKNLNIASNFTIEFQQDWDIQNNFCRLLAHTSLLLEDEDKKIIVIDSGMTKYNVLQDGKTWEVPDLHGALVVLDFTNDFEDTNIKFITVQHRQKGGDGNGSYIPVANRGYMWQDNLGHIYIGGGHFFSQKWPPTWTQWQESRFYLEKEKIPGNSLWQYDINKNHWNKVLSGTQPLRRLASSGYVSIPSTNMSYAFGGYQSNRTSHDTAEDQMWATNGLVIYDHSTNTAQNISEPHGNGYTHAVMHHLGPFDNPKPKHKGLLLILPGKQYNLSENFQEDLDGGKSWNFSQVKFFDLENNEFYIQETNTLNGEWPVSRTRFCSVLVSEEGKWGWDLWIYGGQSSEDPNEYEKRLVGDIWVLKMPSFTWIKIHNTAEAPRRAHTCHAVGQYMVVLGGYPPGRNVDPTAPCDNSLVKLFNFNNTEWAHHFQAGTKYRPPSWVSVVNNTSPTTWGNQTLKTLLEPPPPTTPTTPTTSETPIGAIIGGTLGGVVFAFLVFICGFICGFIYFRKKRNREDAQASHDAETFAEADRHEKVELDVNNSLSASTINTLGPQPSSVHPDSQIMNHPVPELPETGPIHSNTPAAEIAPAVDEMEASPSPKKPAGKRRAFSV